MKDDDEDKNLGRWVNRQRSMFQAGKLRKDRQLSLEKIGLKWSMLATTSWESMFETLCQYVEEKKKGGAEWDGNVPANYRTEDIPPRALGRWINRQRSAYGKNKLKPEYVAKLNEIGLKWSIHERRPTYHQYTSARPETAASSSVVPELALSSSTPTQNTDAAKPQAALAASGVQKDSNVSDKENDAIIIESVRPDHIGSSEGNMKTVISKEKTESTIFCDDPKEACQSIPTGSEVGTSTKPCETLKSESSNAVKMPTTSTPSSKAPISSNEPVKLVVNESVIMAKKATDSTNIEFALATPSAGNTTTDTIKKESGAVADSTKQGSSPPASKVESTKEIIAEKPVNKVMESSSSIATATTTTTTTTIGNVTTDATKIKQESIETAIASSPAIPAVGKTTTVESGDKKLIASSSVIPAVGSVTTEAIKFKQEPIEKALASSPAIAAVGKTITVESVDKSVASSPGKPVGNVTAVKIIQEPIEKAIASSPAIAAVGKTTTVESVDKSVASSSGKLVGNVTAVKIKQEPIEKAIASSPAIAAVRKTTTVESVDKSVASSSGKLVGNVTAVKIKQEPIEKAIASSPAIAAVRKTTTEQSVDKSTVSSSVIIPTIGKTTTEQSVDKSTVSPSVIIPTIGKTKTKQSIDKSTVSSSATIPTIGKTTTEPSVDKSSALSSAKSAASSSEIIPVVEKTTLKESVVTKSTVLSPVISAVGKSITEQSVDKSTSLSSAKPAVGNTTTVATSIKQESVDK